LKNAICEEEKVGGEKYILKLLCQGPKVNEAPVK